MTHTFTLLMMLNKILTSLTGIIHEYDFLKQFPWRSIYYAPYGADKRGPSLIVKNDDNACCGQFISGI